MVIMEIDCHAMGLWYYTDNTFILMLHNLLKCFNEYRVGLKKKTTQNLVQAESVWIRSSLRVEHLSSCNTHWQTVVE